MDATVPAPSSLTGLDPISSTPNGVNEHDLIGGPFAVIESDPGVFTTLVRTLGVRGLQVVELYDIEPWASDHLHPIYGLVFCFLWRKDNDVLPKKESNGLEDEDDSAKLWFANQLSDDACASMAILNVLLNVEEVDVGEKLKEFKNETERMSSPMKGLAISNAHFIRKAHNSLARPADIRGATNVLAIKTLEDAAKAQRSMNPPPAKRRKLAPAKGKKPVNPAAADTNQEEAYHFIGYIPFRGKVWELDGLKSGPVEVGELPTSPSPSGSGETGHRNWMDVVRPVLRMKMRKYGGGDEETGSIRFNLLAIAEDQFCKISDQLALLKRERDALERRLNEAHPQGWEDKVDSSLRSSSREVFTTSAAFQNPTTPVFAKDFGAQRMSRDVQIMNMPIEELPGTWERCIENALSIKTSVEDELENPRLANTENIKRTFDYEPFIKEFIWRCQREGKLAPFLNRKKSRAGTR